MVGWHGMVLGSEKGIHTLLDGIGIGTVRGSLVFACYESWRTGCE